MYGRGFQSLEVRAGPGAGVPRRYDQFILLWLHQRGFALTVLFSSFSRDIIVPFLPIFAPIGENMEGRSSQV